MEITEAGNFEECIELQPLTHRFHNFSATGSELFLKHSFFDRIVPQELKDSLKPPQVSQISSTILDIESRINVKTEEIMKKSMLSLLLISLMSFLCFTVFLVIIIPLEFHIWSSSDLGDFIRTILTIVLVSLGLLTLSAVVFFPLGLSIHQMKKMQAEFNEQLFIWVDELNISRFPNQGIRWQMHTLEFIELSIGIQRSKDQNGVDL